MKVFKTIKLFINGQFPRTESGRSYPVNYFNSEKIYANICQSSRKDFRNATEAALGGYKSWSSKTSFLRAQILYRMAEMIEGKRSEFRELFQETLGFSTEEANAQVDQAIDSFVFYAGFADKYQQVLGSINPVSSSHHNFTAPDPVGVTALIESDNFDFGTLAADISSIICSGNSVVVILGKGCPAVLAPLAEVFATSDLPAGVINLLTGHLSELVNHIASHMEVRSISYQNENEEYLSRIQKLAVDNMKRVRPHHKDNLTLTNIANYVEMKTAWHPVGH